MKHVLLFFALLAGTSSFVSAQEKKAPQSPRVTAEGKMLQLLTDSHLKKAGLSLESWCLMVKYGV